MPDYERLYYKSFNAMTSAGMLIEHALVILRKTQQECEELYIQDAAQDPQEETLKSIS